MFILCLYSINIKQCVFKKDDEKKLKNYIKLVIHVKAHPNKMTLNVSDFPGENFHSVSYFIGWHWNIFRGLESGQICWSMLREVVVYIIYIFIM